jgi:HD-GYP domain-containing protein (c-di-GMP phosphodiesterase class II)
MGFRHQPSTKLDFSIRRAVRSSPSPAVSPMTRRVYSLASCINATDLAQALGDDFEVVTSEADIAARPGVVVVDSDRILPRLEPAQLIRLVADGVPPVATEGALVLPLTIGPAMLARWIGRAFSELEAVAEVQRLNRELAELNNIGIQLSAERDTEKLLALILTKARAITGSDAGSLYIIDENGEGRVLRFEVAQNDSVEVPFRRSTLALSPDSIAGYVALSGTTVSVDDAYALPTGTPYRINRSFDDVTGYRTKSLLVLPLRTPDGETVGVLQLINRKPATVERLLTVEQTLRIVESFSARDRALAESLASQAAVALHNRRLHDEITSLFEGFVQASVTAIEARDPTTSGHSFRVSAYAVALARAVTRRRVGPLSAAGFTDAEILELRYAALLHDFGKVGVRESVLLKAKKLYPDELERIGLRAARLGRELELRCAMAKLAYLTSHGTAGYAVHAARLEAQLHRDLAAVATGLEVVATANEPSVVLQQVAQQLEELLIPTFEDHVGTRHALITAEEARALSIPRGSLTEEEFAEIRSHVVHTFEFLSRIPWTRALQRIPSIAAAHHEKLDGSGYPRRLTAAQITLPTRLLTIADIYDALTARDRPYKAAVSPERALDILADESRAGAIDPDLLELFVSDRIYEATDGEG